MATAAELRLRGERQGKLSLIFDRLAIAFFGRAAEKLARSFNLYEAIQRAGMEIHPVVFAARVLFTTVLVTIISLIIAGVAAALPLPLVVKALIIVLVLAAPGLVFAFGMAYPSMMAGSRAKAVDIELPFFAAYATTMAYAGISIARVIEKVAQLPIFKAIRREAQRIVRDMKIFGEDPLTAIERNAYYHPSRHYRDFMLGYVTTVRTGGDVIHYLEIRTQELFREEMQRIQRVGETVGVIVEGYMSLAVIATLTLYVFFIVSAIIRAGGGPGIMGIVLYSFIALPALTLMIIWALDSVQPKPPFGYREPYKWLAVSLPLGVLTFAVLYALSGGASVFVGGQITTQTVLGTLLAMVAGLIVASLPPMVSYLRYARQTRRLHFYLASFLRDLAETRKTGLSPEKCIQMLADRDYGPLTRVVQRLAAALTIGANMEQAVRKSGALIKDWYFMTIMRFLVDAIDVGGGSPTVLDALARFAQNLADMREELKKRMRMYTFVPYMGAILMALTTIMLVVVLTKFTSGFLGRTTTAAPPVLGNFQIALTPRDIALLILVTAAATTFNAYLMGLVVGKVTGMSVAAGFIHAILLTLVTAAANAFVVLTQAGSLLGGKKT